jgi:hypothetical protein
LKFFSTNAQTASTCSSVCTITRAPQRSVNWFTASGYLSNLRAAFSAKLEMLFGRDCTNASGIETARASSNTRFKALA